jgi:hypothetical protein
LAAGHGSGRMDISTLIYEYPSLVDKIMDEYRAFSPDIFDAISEIKEVRGDSLKGDALIEIKLDKPAPLWRWTKLATVTRFWSIYCAADDYHDLFYCGKSKAIKRFHGRI